MKPIKPLKAYLQSSEYVDFHDEQVKEVIHSFSNCPTEIDRVRNAFDFVRDQISHSYDIKAKVVTKKASEVLRYRHGICYAKSHLLAALLRGMGIPTGFCYQRLTLYDTPKDGYCIHALNTVYLSKLDTWIRLDARGNKEGIDAQFSVDKEKLAFPIRKEYGEIDYQINYSESHPEIIRTLEAYNDCIVMYQNRLPTELS